LDWRCGSSNRAPALQAQSSEFKPQSQKKKKKDFAKIAITFQAAEFLPLPGNS
jgi:hypothetical protein